MTNEAAKEMFDKIKQLVAENTQSVLTFDQEVTQAEVLTAQQQEEIVQMTTVHAQIKEVAESKTRVTAKELQELKTQFTKRYAQYQKNEEQLNALYTKIQTAYDIENKIMKDYLLAESTQMLEELLGKVANQDERIEHIQQVASETSLAEESEVHEMEQPMPSTADQEEIEEVSSEMSLAISDSSSAIDIAVDALSETTDIHDQILSAQEIFLSESKNSTF